ncbi:MAG: diaminopimelate decarboxylase, partial [Desulfobacterales bacterium GWB2_56_26]
MPMSQSYKDRLFPILNVIADHYGTPFHIYDEAGIRNTGSNLRAAFAGIDRFREYYAVKALPNPRILAIMKDMGFGFDCSSIAELRLSRAAGGRGEDLMYTSNNTSHEEFVEAEKDGGAVLNLDDITLIAKVPVMPELICFRYNPGPRRTGNGIIGNPVESKYGVAHDQIVDAYRQAKARGASRFGIHTMLASNELNYEYMVQTADMLLALIADISAELDITFEFINIGGGLGIPYQPGVAELDLTAMGQAITAHFKAFRNNHGYEPALYMESGRFMTGP